MTITAFLAREFPHADELIYLNHAAVAPWPARTASAVKQFAEENACQGAKDYPRWVEREQHLREQLCALLNAPDSTDIALQKNTSEGISIVASGLDWEWGDNVVTTDQEFPSNRFPWQAQRKWGVTLRQVDIDCPQPEQALIAACDERTRVLTVSSVQYGSGARLHLEPLGRFCRSKDIIFFVDAIQSIGAHEIDVQGIQADFVVADAHKWMLGPEGIAVMYAAESVRPRLELRQFGWHMVADAGNYDARDWRPASSARRFECGSMNMLGTHALAASLSLFDELGMATVARMLEKNVLYLRQRLDEIERVTVSTPAAPGRYAGILSFTVASATAASIHRTLLDNGVICALRAGALRFSPHFYTPRKKLDKAVEILKSII